jgi:hypothetical protein
MALTAAQVVEFIEIRFGEYQIPEQLDENNMVRATRAYRLRRIREFLSQIGFPTSPDDRCRLSLLPFIFSEANYDGIHWSEQRADLRQLSDFFVLDYYVFSGGISRSEASSSDFRTYLESFQECAERWRKGEFKFWED